MTNSANSSEISNSPLSRGTPAVRRCLDAGKPSALPRLTPVSPAPAVAASPPVSPSPPFRLRACFLRCVLPDSLKKKNFRFLKFFLLKSHRLRLCSTTLTRRRLSLGLLADISHPRSRFARGEVCRKNLSLALFLSLRAFKEVLCLDLVL